MTRPAEAATSRWADIDFEKKIWTIPAERMKKRRIHIIPLTEQALAILEAIKPYSGHREYVFPADRNPRTHCNSQTANMALKRMASKGAWSAMACGLWQAQSSTSTDGIQS